MTFCRKELLRVHTFNGDSYKKNFVEKILDSNYTKQERNPKRELFPSVTCSPIAVS